MKIEYKKQNTIIYLLNNKEKNQGYSVEKVRKHFEIIGMNKHGIPIEARA